MASSRKPFTKSTKRKSVEEGGRPLIERKTSVVPIESDKEAVAKQSLLRYYNGEGLETIAASLGFKSSAPLISAIIKHCPTEWKHVRTGMVLAAKERIDSRLSEEGLEIAEVRRCEASQKAIMWELERVNDSMYNPGKGASGPATTIVLNIADIHGRGTKESITISPIEDKD
jgi:hypothetical protein